MAEDWRSAYGRVKMELEEFRGTIVPALMDRLRLAERERDAANRLAGTLEREMIFTRRFIHDHGLEFDLASAWAAEIRKKGGDPNG